VRRLPWLSSVILFPALTTIKRKYLPAAVERCYVLDGLLKSFCATS